jgi:hypothetical protein
MNLRYLQPEQVARGKACNDAETLSFSYYREIFAGDTTDETQIIHKVSPGETLNSIAQKYFPLTESLTIDELIRRIKTINGITGSLIHPNQPLHIPIIQSSPLKTRSIVRQRDFEARGIYANRFSVATEKRKRLLDRLIASGGNTVILDVKDMGGRLCYPSKVALSNEIGATANPIIRDPVKLISYFHKRGLHVGVRLVLFYDPLLAEKRPELALRSIATGKPLRENGEVVWVDPGLEAVQRYNLDIARELAEMGADEIQFDYMRYPTLESHNDTVYNPGSPGSLRQNIITEFLAQAREELSPYGVLLSIDVFGVIAWGSPEDVYATGQRIEDLAKYCDVISPMIYPSHFYGPFDGVGKPVTEPFTMVSETCRKFSSILKESKVTLRPWIQAFPYRAKEFGEGFILEQLRGLAHSEARGWLLWSAGNYYDYAWKALLLWNDMTQSDKVVRTERESSRIK